MIPVQPPQQAQPMGPTPQQGGESPVTAQYLRQILFYDPETGVLRWKYREHQGKAWNTRWAGKVAGTDSNGYRSLIIDCGRYMAHRVIWILMTGEWPRAAKKYNGKFARVA